MLVILKASHAPIPMDYHRASHEPTDAQRQAGNYKKRQVQWHGLTISIENEAGSVRSGVNATGRRWETRMFYPYGYIRMTEGVDGDHVDCFLGPDLDAPMVYVVHQRKYGDWENYDEDKCMLGFASEEDATRAFLLCYDNPRFLGPITALPVETFIEKVLATKDNPQMVKAEQFSLFDMPVRVEGSTDKNGVYRKPHIAIRHKHIEAHPAQPTHAASAAKKLNTLDDFIARHGGAPHLRSEIEKMTPEQGAKLIDAMARLDDTSHHDVMEKLGMHELKAAATDEPEPAAAVAEQPKEGDTKTEDGVEYVLRDGRWHRAQEDAVAPTDAEPAAPSEPQEETNEVDAADAREDLADEMALDPHSERSKELVHQAAATPAAPAVEDENDPNSPNYRFKDTGYVGGSRKEMATALIRRAGRDGQQLRATDIDWDEIEANPREAKELIKKSNLFGTVDWEVLKAGGMEPGAGFLIDRVYASVGVEPDGDSALTRRDYALGLETLRDRMERCKTPEQVTGVLQEIAGEIEGVMMNAKESDEYKAAVAVAGELRDRVKQSKEAQEALYNKWKVLDSELQTLTYEQGKRTRRKWKEDPELARKIANLKPQADRAHQAYMDYLEAHPELHSKKRDLGGGWESFDNDLEFSVRQASNKAIEIKKRVQARNLFENPLTRAWMTLGRRYLAVVHWRSYKGSDAFSNHVTSAKNGKIKVWSWAEKETTARPGSTKREVAFQLQVAEKFERTGGRTPSIYSTQDLKEQFGLREVQSGNWVLNDPNSAEFHVTRSAEAFADLADILGANDNTISMNGRLALAFGARGHGNAGFGGAARAHYEPIERVINLTKMGGGGALAHEWFHALDNMVKEAEGGGPAAQGDFATERPESLPEGELRDAFKHLRDTISNGEHRTLQRFLYTDKQYRTAKYNIDSTSSNEIARLIKQANGAAEGVLAVRKYFSARNSTWSSDKMAKKALKNQENWERLAVAYHDGNPSGAEAHVPSGPAMSRFGYEAVTLDKGEHGKYWSETREMAARAFQAYVEDKLEGQGRRNDYLSCFADNKYYSHPVFGKPFPEGEERTKINAAFDRVVAAMKQSGTLAKAAALS